MNGVLLKAKNVAFEIVSSDIYLPENRWSDREMDHFLGLAEGTSKDKYGVEYRHVAGSHESAIYMAGMAAKACLKRIDSNISDIDLVIYASGTHHQSLPYDASALLAFLDAPVTTESFDLNSTCLSFLTALDLAQSLFIARRYHRILIVTSELATGITLNRSFPARPETATLFADGAAAFLLESSKTSLGLITQCFETHHTGYEYCQIKGGGSNFNPHRFTHHENLQACQFIMDGKALFKHTRKIMPGFIAKSLQRASLLQSEVDYLLPHQASRHALSKLPELTGFSPEQLVTRFSTLGNQVAASIPINLHLLREEPDNQGKSVLLLGSAAGLSLGMGVIQL